MSIDMVNDVLDTMTVGPMDDGLFPILDNTVTPCHFPLDASQPSMATWATGHYHDQAHATQPQSFHFGCPGDERNDDFINSTLLPALPIQWVYPEDGVAGWDRAESENGDPTTSASSSSTAPGSVTHLWHDPTPPVCDVTSTGMDSAMYMDTSSWVEQFMTTGLEPSTESSWGDNAVFEPYVASHQSEPTQSQRTPAGWTYRQILETVAYPPRDAPHLWHAKVSQLAADLGMPRGTTGENIITFVIHVATVKNELDQVAPLVRALAGAARLLEGRAVVPKELQPLVAKLYPGVARMLGFLDCAGEAGSNTALQGHCDEYQISLASSEGQQLSDFPTNHDETKEEKADEYEPVRQRQRFAEEDVYCRVDACLLSFKDPHVCAKHRRRHFHQIWQCPGPCRTQTTKEGKFARKETLKRHLTFPKHAECKEAVLKALGLERIPASSTAWMTPFCDGPERPWECPGYQLTDLETVKERLRDPNFTAPPAEPIRGRHRYK